MNVRDVSPIFIIGRQHSGNTMLSCIFERMPNVLSMKGEGCFFEYWTQLEKLRREERIRRLIAVIRNSEQPPLDKET